jgi:hypothetical protein
MDSDYPEWKFRETKSEAHIRRKGFQNETSRPFMGLDWISARR